MMLKETREHLTGIKSIYLTGHDTVLELNEVLVYSNVTTVFS